MNTTEADTPARELPGVIADLSRRLDPDRIGTGPLAELRRMDVTAPPLAYWRLLFDCVPGSLRQDRAERAWVLIINGMARIAGKGRASHAPGIRLGEVLADTGYADQRLIRLLRAEGDAFADELRAVGHWLDLKGQAIDWVPLAQLALSHTLNRGVDSITRSIARDYFRALLRRERQDTANMTEERNA